MICILFVGPFGPDHYRRKRRFLMIRPMRSAWYVIARCVQLYPVDLDMYQGRVIEAEYVWA